MLGPGTGVAAYAPKAEDQLGPEAGSDAYVPAEGGRRTEPARAETGGEVVNAAMEGLPLAGGPKSYAPPTSSREEVRQNFDDFSRSAVPESW
jgi:hypothetical protein